MIIPSFNLTATEKVLPNLALDFTTASLDSRITFTRITGASNPATFVGSNGYVTAASNDQPRFDYDPVTLACKGLLIEESRTNNFTNSSNFNSWTKSNMSVSTGAITAPDGTLTGDKLIPNTTNTDHLINQAKTLTAITYTNSVYAKKGEYGFIALYGVNFATAKAFFNLNTGAVGTVTGTGSPVARITNCGSGWYRCELSFTASASNVAYGYSSANANGVTFFAGDGTSGLYIWGAQLEAGAFATSYIPTTSAALTRNADVATMTGTNFSDWFSINGSMQTQAMIEGKNTSTHNCCQSLVGSGIYIDFRFYDRFTNTSRISGTNSLLLQPSGSTQVNASQKLSFGMTDGVTSSAAFIGSTAVVDSSITAFGSATSLKLGSGQGGSDILNGWLQKFNFYPYQLTDRQIQAISK